MSSPPETGGEICNGAVLDRTMAGLEARLGWSPTAGRGNSGRIPDALRPVRKGGHGPAVWVAWRDVLTLAGEHVTPGDDAKSAVGRRYRRRVTALIEADYSCRLPGAQRRPATR